MCDAIFKDLPPRASPSDRALVLRTEPVCACLCPYGLPSHDATPSLAWPCGQPLSLPDSYLSGAKAAR